MTLFETLFSDQDVLRRHREGPLVKERVAYLQQQASRGLAPGTLRGRALYCLRVAVEISRHPPERLFSLDEVGRLLAAPNNPRPLSGKEARPRSAALLRATAIEFLGSLGRLRPDPPPEEGEHDSKVDAFLLDQRQSRWQSEATCQCARWHIGALLDHLHQRGVAWSAVAAEDLDRFFAAMSVRWSRGSLSGAALTLRQWLDYGGRHGWVRPGLGATVLGPQRHKLEGLPIGPPWETVARMLDAVSGDDPVAIRDRAILLLLSLYGVRSGELRRLGLDDIDWVHDRIVCERSKSRRREELGLHPLVGEAIVRYLREARPTVSSRCVFLTVRAPHRPLTAVAWHGIVNRRYPTREAPTRGRGPHGLRHACARQLVESGYSFKQVGDYLGHRSPDSTSVYAKVNNAAFQTMPRWCPKRLETLTVCPRMSA